jgi:oligopeptide/dipeptide ABC transporter ATP-binding protein
MNRQLSIEKDIVAKTMTEAPVISVSGLSVEFKRPDGSSYRVVDNVSFDVGRQEIVGIVGESGSGKSLTARSILRLVPPNAKVGGQVRFKDTNVFDLSPGALQKLRGGEIAMVFQDAMTSFNPVLRIGDQIQETLALHNPGKSRKSMSQRVVELLQRVGILGAKKRARAYPHEFSGGMRQRALTAMALANDPVLLIADEPTTALDVTVQDQIMDLLRDLNTRNGTSILLITHNISVVASLCSRVIVMYAGAVVEDGSVEQVLTKPAHPYTWSLLRSVPRLEKSTGRLTAISGHPPDPQSLPPGCKFTPRCPFAIARCSEAAPSLDHLGAGHHVRCWLPMTKTMAQTAESA